MNMLGCKCLNIVIETEANIFPIIEREQLELTIEESEDSFFKNENLRQVEKLNNINKSLTGLVETREVGSWIIHYCMNCKVHTHAVHKEKGASCVLVNSNLLNSDAIKKLRNSEIFSKVFGIVIDTSQFDDENEDTFYSTEVEPIVKGFKQTLTETMRKEAAVVEERIKKFADEQYTILDNLREKLFNEEQTLIRTVLSHVSTKPKKPTKKEEEEATNPLSPASPKLQESPERKSSQSTSSNQLRPTPKRQKSSPVQSNYEPEFLFGFDDIDDNPSDKEEEEADTDSDDALTMKINERYHSRNRTSNMKIAKSLPMDIPVFMRPRRNEDLDLDEDAVEPLEDNVDIAASIKKLAKSVHGGGIFGELPRPRFSTQL